MVVQSGKKKPQRVRTTNRAKEAKQFSSVRLPRRSEMPMTNVTMHSTPTLDFDPIPSDSMFSIVANSKYWPPVPLEELRGSWGALNADGMDLFDRREDEARGCREKIAKISGEVNHPRGKARKQEKIKFEHE